MITAEEVVNTILNVNEDDENVGEGVPADAMVMVKLSNDGLMLTIDEAVYEPETNTLWLNVSEY